MTFHAAEGFRSVVANAVAIALADGTPLKSGHSLEVLPFRDPHCQGVLP